MIEWLNRGVEWLGGEFRNPLVLFGLTAQFVFFLRFFVQWIESERRGHSTIPVAFWWLSLVGGTMTFVYALQKRDIVFMLSQAAATFIYLRNLRLIYRPRKPAAFPLAGDEALDSFAQKEDRI